MGADNSTTPLRRWFRNTTLLRLPRNTLLPHAPANQPTRAIRTYGNSFEPSTHSSHSRQILEQETVRNPTSLVLPVPFRAHGIFCQGPLLADNRGCFFGPKHGFVERTIPSPDGRVRLRISCSYESKPGILHPDPSTRSFLVMFIWSRTLAKTVSRQMQRQTKKRGSKQAVAETPFEKGGLSTGFYDARPKGPAQHVSTKDG